MTHPPVKMSKAPGQSIAQNTGFTHFIFFRPVDELKNTVSVPVTGMPAIPTRRNLSSY